MEQERRKNLADSPDPVAKIDRSPLTNAAGYAALGLQFVVLILLGLYGGRWVDRRFGTYPVFLLIGVFGGAAAGFFFLYQRLMAAQREDSSRRS